jgi:protein-tyrosine-phosphatase
MLFLCGHNIVRSPIAAALARHYFGHSIYVASAGVRAGEADPFTAAVLAEIGLDIARHRPQTLEELEDFGFDLIVTLAPEAHHAALELTRTLAVEVEYWPTIDPTVTEGNREQRLQSYRSVRDGLRDRILERFR